MMNHLIERINQLSKRERMLLAGGVIMIFIGLVYWGGYQPIQNNHQNAQRSLNNEKRLYEYVTEQADEIVTLRSQSGGNTNFHKMSISQAVNRTTKQYNINIDRLQPRGDNELQLWIGNLPFSGLILWLAQLENRYNIHVEEIDVEVTGAEGTVKVMRLRLKKHS